MGELASVPALAAGAAPLTMSSLEIADLMDKRHDNVMRDIRAMLTELHGEGGVLKFEDTHTNAQNGQAYPIYRLPKRETLVLVSGYSVELQRRAPRPHRGPVDRSRGQVGAPRRSPAGAE